MKREILKVTWKIVRRKNKIKGQGKTPKTYCSYIAENEKRKHRLKTSLGTKLFELLNNTYVSKRSGEEIQIDGIYIGDNLIYVCNFRKIK